MIIIPLSGKLSWRNPPWITMGIILINCLVFFVFQTGDDQRYNEAMSFYFDSDLSKIEVSSFIAYLESRPDRMKTASPQNQQEMDKKTLFHFYEKMQKDQIFLHKLHNGEIISPQDDVYTSWKQLRETYEDLLSKVISHRYGFIPGHIQVLTAFTHMFLHGSFMHLLGNMLFLWLVGCVLEMGWERTFYATTYLFSGLFAAGAFALMNMGSHVPLIGASGAISGLIGAYTVSYGKTKIKIFYSLGFYFDYIKVRAIFLLPAWIANELFQLLFGGDSAVAYVAHLGGLISGALLAFCNLRLLGRFDMDIFEEDPKEKKNALLEEAMKRMENLDMNGARHLLKKILEIDPKDHGALLRLYQIDKLNPRTDSFHETASRLLYHLATQKEEHEKLHEIFKEYLRIAKEPKIHLDLLFRIETAFTVSGHLEDSEKILAFILKSAPNSRKLPSGLLQLARAYRDKGMLEKGNRCLHILSKRFPESPESHSAKKWLSSSG